MMNEPKKILVTGAGGYIGRHVVEQLLDMGHSVLAADLRLDDVDKRAEKITVDIFSGDQDIFAQTGHPDVCIHMAWRDGFNHNSSAHMGDLSSHYLFLTHMIEGGLKQLVVMGTMHEVGYWEGAIAPETPCNPSSFYGIAKNALRQAMILLCEQKDVTLQWLRAYYILGDDLHNHSIFSKLLLAAQQGKKTFPFTTGKNLYDFISIDDLTRQIAACASQKEVTGIINCCTGQPMSLADRVEAFIKEHNLDIQLEYGAFPDRPYDSPGTWGNPDKINQVMKITQRKD